MPLNLESEERPEKDELPFSEENNEILKKFANEKNVVMLALIAPLLPLKISPTSEIYASIRILEEYGIEIFLDEVSKRLPKKSRKDLYLLLHSPGGISSSSYVISKALRKNFQNIITFIPHIAASGATMIAISSNEIIMGEISRLSPIDPTIYTPDKGHQSALAHLRGVAKMRKKFATVREEDICYPDRYLIQSINLPLYEEMSGHLKLVEDYAVELMNMSQQYDEKIVNETVNTLVYGFSSHDEVIDYDGAKKLKLNATWFHKYQKEWDLMRTWLGEYIFKESPVHHIRYVIPEKKKNGGKKRGTKKKKSTKKR